MNAENKCLLALFNKPNKLFGQPNIKKKLGQNFWWYLKDYCIFSLQSEDRRDVLLNLLQIHLGEKVREYIEFQQKDWSQESYNGGCFLKSLVPGSTRFFSQDLREPFDRWVLPPPAQYFISMQMLSITLIVETESGAKTILLSIIIIMLINS